MKRVKEKLRRKLPAVTVGDVAVCVCVILLIHGTLKRIGLADFRRWSARTVLARRR